MSFTTDNQNPQKQTTWPTCAAIESTIRECVWWFATRRIKSVFESRKYSHTHTHARSPRRRKTSNGCQQFARFPAVHSTHGILGFTLFFCGWYTRWKYATPNDVRFLIYTLLMRVLANVDDQDDASWSCRPGGKTVLIFHIEAIQLADPHHVACAN